MAERIVGPGGTDSRFTDPGDVARGRKELGWTHEQVAEAVGALPLEVAAWESGAVHLAPHERDRILWQVRSAHYERELAARAGCDWLRQHQSRLDDLTGRGPKGAAWASRRVATHRAVCERCQAAIAALGPAPVDPAMHGRGGWVARLSPGPRLAVESALMGLWMGLVFWLGNAFQSWIGIREPWFPHLVPLWVGAFCAWWTLTHGLLRPLGDEHPYAAGQVQSALMIIPAAFAWGRTEPAVLQDPFFWMVVVLGCGLVGLVVGTLFDPDSEHNFRRG